AVVGTAVGAFGLAAGRHQAGAVAPFLEVREPVVRLELDPERREDVEGVGLLVVVLGRARQQGAADPLRIGLQQADAIAVAVPRELVRSELGERGLELDETGEALAGRAHRWIGEVVADARERPVAGERAAAVLLASAADSGVAGLGRRQAQLGRRLESRPRPGAAALPVSLVGGAGVAQVERDQLEPLVL